jgi:hypothetical protein
VAVLLWVVWFAWIELTDEERAVLEHLARSYTLPY